MMLSGAVGGLLTGALLGDVDHGRKINMAAGIVGAGLCGLCWSMVAGNALLVTWVASAAALSVTTGCLSGALGLMLVSRLHSALLK